MTTHEISGHAHLSPGLYFLFLLLLLIPFLLPFFLYLLFCFSQVSFLVSICSFSLPLCRLRTPFMYSWPFSSLSESGELVTLFVTSF